MYYANIMSINNAAPLVSISATSHVSAEELNPSLIPITLHPFSWMSKGKLQVFIYKSNSELPNNRTGDCKGSFVQLFLDNLEKP